MESVIICSVCSVVVSAIVTKILATHYFEIVDGYVSDMTDKTREFVEEVLSKEGKL